MGASLASNFTKQIASEAQFDLGEYSVQPAIDCTTGLIGTMLSIAVFQTIHKFFCNIFILVPPKGLGKKRQSHTDANGLTPLEYWKWKNLWISWFHALVSGSWVLLNVVLYPEFVNDLILFHNYSSYWMVCFSAGYFIYDLVDMWRNNLILKQWELTVHHIAIDVIMLWNLSICRCIGWNIIALSAEVNSFFLHTRKLMQMHGLEKSNKYYKLNMILNLFTFVVFRFGSCSCMLVGIYYQRARVTAAFYVAIIACLIVMSGINPVLFYRLVKSDLLPKAGRKFITYDANPTGSFSSSIESNIQNRTKSE